MAAQGGLERRRRVLQQRLAWTLVSVSLGREKPDWIDGAPAGLVMTEDDARHGSELWAR